MGQRDIRRLLFSEERARERPVLLEISQRIEVKRELSDLQGPASTLSAPRGHEYPIQSDRFLSNEINMRKTVAIGFLGTVLDQGGRAPRRYRKWRPTISLCEQPDLPIDRLELLHSLD
ncbi:RNA repair transcriptional activator RtcR family protein, partial [Burkholderia cepacia]